MVVVSFALRQAEIPQYRNTNITSRRRSESGIAHYAYKDETRKYLEAINKEKDVSS
jgi:hypothetical protein